MLTLGDLQQDPSRIAELGDHDVLVAAADEKVVTAPKAGAGQTMVFQHETMKMMRSERADRVEKLCRQLGADSAVIPLKKKDSSYWDHITLGRASTADIVLDDKAISNVHAHFETSIEEGSVSLQDVGSSNGTHVNQQPLHPHQPTPLSSGDVVRFGQTIFYYIKSPMFRELLGLPLS